MSSDDDLGYDTLEEVRLQRGERVMVVPVGTIPVVQPETWQGVVIFTGTTALIFGDNVGEYAADRHNFTAVERAVAVARLRAITDIIENPQP